MKQFFKTLGELIHAMAQARAATALTRQGKIEEAKSLYK